LVKELQTWTISRYPCGARSVKKIPLLHHLQKCEQRKGNRFGVQASLHVLSDSMS